MPPNRTLVILLGATALTVAGVTFLLFFREAPEQGAADPVPPSAAVEERFAPLQEPVPAPPAAITDDLTRTEQRIDHSVVKRPTANPAPSLEYTYNLMTELPEITRTAVPVLRYATMSPERAQELAASYGMPGAPPYIEGDTYTFVSDLSERGGGMLKIRILSGFSSFTRISLPEAGTPVASPSDAIRTAAGFLRSVGQYPDGKLDAPVTYQRLSRPNVTFVEFHRAWDPLPIIESVGMLRASTEDRLLGRPKDRDIVRTSDRTDGYVRADDFNTIVVEVDAEGRVLHVAVRMRMIASTLEDQPIRTPEDAWKRLQAGEGILGLTVPSAANVTAKDWGTMFPENRATSSDARIRDVQLTYVEKGADARQFYLQPVYIFRGQAKLATGPLADFVVAVPALDTSALSPEAP